MSVEKRLKTIIAVLAVIFQAGIGVFNPPLLCRERLMGNDCLSARRVKGGQINPEHKSAVDLILWLAGNGDYQALGYLEGKVRNNILRRDLSQEPLSAEELYLLRGLADIEQRTLVPLVTREDVSVEIRKEFLGRLSEGGTIDSDLPKVLAQAEREGRVSAFFRHITEVYEKFEIVAPGLLVEKLLSGDLTLKDLETYIPQIEKASFSELIPLLKKDLTARLAYYCLRQSQFRYGGVVYTYEKFSRVIDTLPDSIERANEPGVVEELRKALAGSLDRAAADFIISQIKQGRPPLVRGSRFLDERGGFIPQQVSLEYSNQVHQTMQEMLNEAYRGLIALFKINSIAQRLGIEIEEMTTEEAIEAKLRELLRGHPELEAVAGRDLAALTGRMKSKPLSGALLQAGSPDKIKTLSEITAPDLERLLAYLDKKGIDMDKAMDELEAELAESLKPSFRHIREVFKTILKIKEAEGNAQGAEGRLRSTNIYLSYAEKDRLMDFLRFADGAQCCITSDGSHYLQYVPYALTDQMTHVFVLSDDKTNQIGYILTHYGIDEQGRPVLLSLHVYLRHGYHTENGLKNIWEIMEEIAKDMGVARILQASGSIGLGRAPGWLPKEKVSVKRLQSLRGDDLVDDLGLRANTMAVQDFYIIDIKR